MSFFALWAQRGFGAQDAHFGNSFALRLMIVWCVALLVSVNVHLVPFSVTNNTIQEFHKNLQNRTNNKATHRRSLLMCWYQM